MSTHPNVPGAADLAALWDLAVEMLSVFSIGDGRFTHVNAAWERTLGWSTEEFVEKDVFTELVHPDDYDETIEALGAVAQPGGEVSGFENRYRHRDGTYRYLRWWARTDDTGERIYSVTADVTTERQAADALRRSEERWRLVQQEAPIGLTLVGLDGRWLAVNPAMCELTGYTEEELLELTFQDITHPDDLDEDLALLEQLTAGEIPSYRLEKRYIRKSGQPVWILLAVSLARTPEGEPDHYIAQIADISKQKRQERELAELVATLERANADLERFTALAAHDLRSPLATVGSFLDLLKEEPLTDDGRTFLGHARGGIGKLRRRTDALLRFARATARTLDVREHDVEALVREAVSLLGALVRDRGADISWDIPPGTCVEVDGETVGSVLQNLLSNAVRYVPGDRTPEVRITTRRTDHEVHVIIDDNGPGVPSEERIRMFEPFVRGPSKLEGTGLGLATAQRLAERNGGSVAFEDGPQEGTRIVLRLPAPSDSRTAPKRDRSPQDTSA